MDIEKKLFSNTEQSFSAEELQELVRRFDSLEKRASDGDHYRSVLIKDVNILAALTIPQLGRDTLDSITKALSVKQLDELKKSGMTVNENPDIDSFKEATRSVYTDFEIRNEWTSNLVAQMREAVKQVK